MNKVLESSLLGKPLHCANRMLEFPLGMLGKLLHCINKMLQFSNVNVRSISVIISVDEFCFAVSDIVKS